MSAPENTGLKEAIDRAMQGIDTAMQMCGLAKVKTPHWDCTFGITERGDNGVNKTWLGFCYGSFIPRFRWNGGRPSRGEVMDIGWHWLCFHGSITRWPS
jgi:hypothetical protein